MDKRKLLRIAAIVVAGAALVALGIFVSREKPKEAEKPSQTLIGIKHPNQGQKHLKTIDEAHEPYNSDLPSSGPHYIFPAEWGIHTGVVLDEVMMHNLEHGGIVIAYRPDLPKEDIAKLETIAANLQTFGHAKAYKVLMFAREKNTHPIQLASWLYTLDLESVDEDKIEQFYGDHLDQSPEGNVQ